ncbi:unnamed protein product [Notodromas monacha]|uniref:Uncharacterized protein n=1 Tax=Notodromas monacha TaxID=399045 RepID=A0A7R9GBH1_9CRUS|nr:unnamed protein product [Notodromas monacha]CAG0914992.1 unnamed protein product [Notodromas monacha]
MDLLYPFCRIDDSDDKLSAEKSIDRSNTNFLVHYRKITKSFIAKKSPVVISEVDGSSPEGSPLLATESVEFYPQLVLYRAGMQIRFTGERLDMRVVKWIQELTTPRVISLTSLADASNALMKHQDVLMGFFNGNNTRGAELFMDSTIGIHDDVKRIVVQLNHPELTRLLPSPASNPDNEVIILLRKYSASSVEWAKIPMKLLRLRKEKELSALGAARRSPRLSGGGNDALPEGAEGMDDQGGQAFELPGDAFPGAVGGGGQQ